MGKLSGKTAIVLGAGGAGNMGQAIARALMAEGAHAVATGRKAAPLEAFAAETGASWHLCDIASKADVDALFDDVEAKHGGVDIAVNATGWGLMKPLPEVTEEDLDQMVALQFKGVHYFLAACVRTMTRGGSVVQVSSATTRVPIFDHSAYIGTKTGSEALIRCVANQYGGQGLRANIVSPGLTESPMTTGAFATPGLSEAFRKEYPLGRIGTSDDIAAAVVWLAGDDCFMSGQNLQINGGLTLRRNPRPEEIGAAVAAAMAANSPG
jgi:2-hydroxycyclohexanecarboxyl-CoA dehydrogenase